MLEMLQQLAAANPYLIAFGALIFDIPRYTLSLVALALFGARRVRRSGKMPAGQFTVSVIMPTFNGGAELGRTIASLHRQTVRPVEIIVVDDGSTDDTRAIADEARSRGLVDIVVCHGTRCGRSAAINAGARFATGDLIFAADADTIFEPDVVARLAAVFADPRVAGACCNIAVANERASIWTGLQSVEYLMSISAGKTLFDIFRAISCLSGACSMYRRDVFMGQGGLDVGPGEDLEFSLRLRRLGWLVRFVPDVWAETSAPVGAVSLLRQRARWDRDALRIRLMTYGELSFFHPFEHLSDTLQRLDFIIFDLAPTLTFPFYVVYALLMFGNDAVAFFAALYLLLLWISLFNMALASAMFHRSSSFFSLGLALIFPLYQSVFLKCGRFVFYSAEIMFAASSRDDFVPPRVRRALFGAG
jgi:cellulose synthase/poly-beta-1,6-N-acetylglucosamine synthase-like glycosyltransferase